MAIQFPNFLNAQTAAPDYSGIGDAVENFYKGYSMPNDALIKKIQAQFAQPEAEQALLSSRLSNRKQQMGIDQLSMDIAQQRELEKQLRNALAGNGSAGASAPTMPMSGGQMPQMMAANAAPMTTASRAISQAVQGQRQPMQSPQNLPYTPIDPAMMATGRATPMAAPMQQAAPTDSMQPNVPAVPQAQPEMNEIVVAKGSPQLAGIDAMYDNNPLSRAFLEKKGYKKSQEVKFDAKTGKTTLITKYPSGKVTVQSQGGKQAVSSDNIPLTTKSLNDTVKQIRATDAVMPYIDELIRMGEAGELPHFSYLPTDAHATYKRTASEGLDKYMVATGLNPTDKSLDTIRDILFRSGGESTKNYLKGLKKAKANKMRERQSNIKMVNEGLSKNISLEDTPDDSAPDYSNLSSYDNQGGE